MITGNGLEDFYARRSALSNRPDSAINGIDSSFLAYDDPAIQAEFVETDRNNNNENNGGNKRAELRLLIGGITCTACAWLIERTLTDLAEVESASLNLQQACLHVSFRPEAIKVSSIFARVAALGYSVQPWKTSASRNLARGEYRRDLKRLGVAAIGMMQVGMFAIALHAGDIQGIDPPHRTLLRIVSLIVCAFVLVFSARGFFESAWRHLKQGLLVMDLPVSIAIACAFSASVVATIRGVGQVYYDSVVMFTFFLLCARFIEKRMRYHNTLSWSDAENILPDSVQAWRNDKWTRIARRDLKHGERLLVAKGEIFPADGLVVAGASEVREDAFSGEALPRVVSANDSVFAGTINLSASIEMQSKGRYAETRLAALQRSIEHAGRDKPKMVQLADRVASYFVGAILLLTTLTFAVWWQIDSDKALWVALSVLVISCPCALSLATPSCLSNAAALLRKNGVLVSSENALDALTKVTHVFFDKTGTLTTGQFRTIDCQVCSEEVDESSALALCAALQQHSTHPIAAAFSSFEVADQIEQIEYQVGLGMSGIWNGQELRLGSPKLSADVLGDLPPPTTDQHWLLLSWGTEALAWIAVADQPRIDAKHLVESFRENGIHVTMLTGDASQTAANLGVSLEFDDVLIGQSPQQKLKRIQQTIASGGTTLMIGDGLNDAAVMQGANCSIAVSGATDLARAQSDFIVMATDLLAIERLRSTAQRTRDIVRQNLGWALSYNAIGIPFAAVGFVPPWMAALGMSLSSLIVVGNASRLQHLPIQS